jgi:hypothetical protein
VTKIIADQDRLGLLVLCSLAAGTILAAANAARFVF